MSASIPIESVVIRAANPDDPSVSTEYVQHNLEVREQCGPKASSIC